MTEVDSSTDLINVSLGISEERYDVLGVAVERIFNKSKSFIQCFIEISHYTKDPNEFGWMMWNLGTNIQTRKNGQHNGPPGNIGEMLREMSEDIGALKNYFVDKI